MKEKKNEIYIGKSREGYSLHYREKDECHDPHPIVSAMEFYDIIDGLIGMPKKIYEKGINKIYFNQDYINEISKKEKEIFKGLINILKKSANEKRDLNYKMEEIKNTLTNKENKEKNLIWEILKNKEESFNSLYKIMKSKKPHERKKE